MDPPLDPSGIAVPAFDEDLDENFTGPEGIADFFNEGYDEDEDYYDDDGEGYEEPEPLVRSAAQRADTQDAAQAETVSGHTQLGAVPGSASTENALPGFGMDEPELRPPQPSTTAATLPPEEALPGVSFLSSGDEAGHRSNLYPTGATNPDGSPLEDLGSRAAE